VRAREQAWFKTGNFYPNQKPTNPQYFFIFIYNKAHQMSDSLFRKKTVPAILKEAEEGLTDAHGHHEDLKRVLTV